MRTARAVDNENRRFCAAALKASLQTAAVFRPASIGQALEIDSV